MCFVLFLSHCSVRKPFILLLRAEERKSIDGTAKPACLSPLPYSQTVYILFVICWKSFFHIVLGPMQDKAEPESPGSCLQRAESTKGRQTDRKQLASPCVRLLFSSLTDPAASYPGPMRLATLPVPCTTAGRTIHIEHHLNEYCLEMCNMAALFLRRQINKHQAPLCSERNNMSSLLSGHYTLEISSSKVHK